MSNKWSFSGFFVLLASVLFMSCENKESLQISSEGNLQVRMLGIEEYVSVEANNFKKKASASMQSGVQASDQPAIQIASYDEFDAITSVEVAEPFKKAGVIKKASISPSIKKLAAVSKLEGTTKYRLLFYKTSDNQVVVDEEILAGEAPIIQVPANVEYKWVAYSINESTLPSTTGNVINKGDIANKDLLYASGLLTLSHGDNFLNLTFQRYTTKYEATINTRGLFATIHNDTKVSLINQNGGLFKTADFNILTGAIVSGTEEEIDLTGSALTSVTPGEDDIKKAVFYTILDDPSQSNELGLRFAPLKITMTEDNSVRTFAAAGVGFQHNAITETSTRGRVYSAEATLVESAIQVGDAYWARANLWFDPLATDPTKQYRHRVSPHYRDPRKVGGWIDDADDLWRFNTTTPAGTSQTAGFDPCTAVYPNNFWKLPSEQNFLSLSASFNNAYLVNRNDFQDGISLNIEIPPLPPLLGVHVADNYRMELVGKWNAAGTGNPAYDVPYGGSSNPLATMNDLFLSGVGYKNTSNVITNRPSYLDVLRLDLLSNIVGAGLLQGLSGSGYYWTAKGFSTTGSVSNPTYYSFSNTDGSILDLDLLASNLLTLLPYGNFTSTTNTMGWNNRMNIRCIKNTNYPAAPVYN